MGSGPAIELQKIRILAKKIIFSDEAYLDLGGYVNKKIVAFGAHKTRTHTANATKTSHCLVRIFVQRHNWVIFLPTVNGDRYRAMFNEFLFTKIEEEDIGNIWFQQDGITCHTAEATLDVLSPVFEGRIISRRAHVVWPPRSCDLTPLDYYLWGAVKDNCYSDQRQLTF